MRRTFRSSGFIIFFGTRGVKGSDGTEPVQAVCPLCKQPSTIVGRVMRRWFTLFLVPVFPIQSKDSGHRFTQCQTCKKEINRTIEQFGRSATAAPAGNDHAAAIQLYNALRDRPDDSATLLQLIRMYVAMNEPADAEAACRTFPIAYQNEPACAEAMMAIWK